MAIAAYNGKMLRVDLSSETVRDEALDEETLRQWFGGTGLGVKIMYDEVPPGVEWDSPENRLILASGPLGGTRVPGSGTYAVVTKGPLTNLMACSHANGFFGARMRFAGYDAIVVQGQARSWKYLYLHDDGAELRDAAHLVGKDAWETEDVLVQEIGGGQISVTCIGPAGENLVKFAGVCGDHGHIASSNGVGAVMGSKRLKAIVAQGLKAIPVANSERFSQLSHDWFESAKSSPLGEVVGSLGTLGYFSAAEQMGWLPVRNLQTAVFPEHPAFNGDAVRASFPMKPRPCYSCTLAHAQECEVTEGKYAGFKGEEPEYEDMASWSSLVGITDPATSIYITNVNDRLGMDVKECGFVISLAMECYQKGVITREQADGLDLSWGNDDAIIALLGKIARREGFGDVLAEGVMRAAERIGGDAPKFAVYTRKGNAPHTHDPRGMWGLLFGQATSDMGSIEGGAVELLPDPDVGIPEPIASFDPEKVPWAQTKTGPRRQFEDTMGICMFLCGASLDIIAETLSAATGWQLKSADLLEVGERIMNTQRAFSIRHGHTPADERASPRLLEAPPDGAAAGVSIGPNLETMVRAYYEQMGWDEETGRPLPDTLRRLGLGKVAADLWEEERARRG